MFKLTHPQDLISRLFILEYIRDLGVDVIIPKLTEAELRFWAYKFTGDNDETLYDINWEYLLFVIPIDNLSKIMERYLNEIDELERVRQPKAAKKRDELLQERLETPIDINLMDVAKADMDSKKNKLEL